MKNVLLFLFVSVFIAGSAMAQSKNAEVKIKTSAVCKMCKKTLETSLSYEKGVQSSNLDVDSKVLTVAYNPKKTNPDQIRKAVAKTGYDADNVPAEEKAYNQLEDCCKKTAHSDGNSDHH
ncbi:heavy metal-associated domain-containing protein [Xanthocytophaga agilis]|uniref:Heavy metal-associated domain-containing protein n=1 Tax=Xanthocytophaga agilis TaxID=3048010 RepID=A0AAE3RBG2_9BACT|nr:heavy metal-associated domain-containing protein [Xanthocytophaga agilis]MDJ1505152.1 heavy metal-associated domain-containing protein [Xanthocytophaga agilis]